MRSAAAGAHLLNNGPGAQASGKGHNAPTYPCLSLTHLKSKYNTSKRTKTSVNYWHVAQKPTCFPGNLAAFSGFCAIENCIGANDFFCRYPFFAPVLFYYKGYSRFTPEQKIHFLIQITSLCPIRAISDIFSLSGRIRYRRQSRQPGTQLQQGLRCTADFVNILCCRMLDGVSKMCYHVAYAMNDINRKRTSA